MKNILTLIIVFLLVSCSQKSVEIVTKIEGDSLEEQMIEAYNAGVTALDQGDVLFATKKFNEAEILFPQSEWAPRSALMAAYSYYLQNYYAEALSNLERFLKTY